MPVCVRESLRGELSHSAIRLSSLSPSPQAFCRELEFLQLEDRIGAFILNFATPFLGNRCFVHTRAPDQRFHTKNSPPQISKQLPRHRLSEAVGDSVLGVYSLSTLPPLTYFSQQPLASLIMMLALHESPSPGLSYREPHASDLNAGAEKSPVGGCQRFHFGGLSSNFATLVHGNHCKFDHAAWLVKTP